MVMVAQVCEAYHWSLRDAFKLTMPQMVLMNHAASVNTARVKNSVDAKQSGKRHRDETDPICQDGKRLSEMDANDLARYYSF